ncbi:MAG: M28 family peptidase, partial [Phycisphaerales bacterium]|nr:M28 family peptidase [Phycisphaerales bacterium]
GGGWVGGGVGLRGFAAARVAGQRQAEAKLLELPAPESLRSFHEMFASEPHIAGTAGDMRVIAGLEAQFRAMGLEVETHWFWPYLSLPPGDGKAAEVSIVSPEVVELPVAEPPVEGDPFSSRPGLPVGFNAYAAPGDVTAGVVYANYGTKADFEELVRMGVDVRGTIVLARYGGNFRGYKSLFAEQFGAAGVIIFTDPEDSGYAKGLMYPEGGFATPRQLQMGSILVLPYPGDPLTPNYEATEDAPRLDPSAVGLPKIPVQPVGWSAAEKILSRMKGAAVPEGWQGGLPFTYRVEGGPELKVRLVVRQDRGIHKTANVVATLRGSKFPEQKVIVGAHHDAWSYGAGDPLAGTILVLESARSFAELAKQGWRPERTIQFAAWGAEEFGIIGSVEYVERYREDLRDHGVAYINLDMATMGSKFWAAAHPPLARTIIDVTRLVPAIRPDPGTRSPKPTPPGWTVYQDWLSRAGRESKAPTVGNLGGGSDHVGFYFHAGVPSAAMGSSGGRGTSYHSNYDNLHWYRAVVGDDYLPAQMNTRIVNLTVARLANADVVPLDPAAYPPALRGMLDELEKRAGELGGATAKPDFGAVRRAIDGLEASADRYNAALERATAEGGADAGALASASALLRDGERAWLAPGGLPGRAWYRHQFMANDEDSGYAAWSLPEVRLNIERRNADQLARSVARLAEVLGRVGERIDAAAAVLRGEGAGGGAVGK